ncbi:hypothetical protein [Mucilaginibacter rubeus]|uniref:Uncharacterized protein n=1 Tax=Mucilaginibacter rubeus TaxID=2027860 RepID=A0A5C1I6N0_9SPHI|nr:hypothetical protein [Mucilaginibacter rubeus]QEM13456.1 hypothetical protein DEO27_026750 [Mucilaginibacter rubeus]
MKTKYLLSFKGVEGSVEFTYNETGLLVEYVCSAELSTEQLVFMLKRIPLLVEQVKEMPGIHPSFTVVELTQDLSFKIFWEAYGQKIHPHRCEPLWNRLKDSDKIAALNAMPSYFRYLTRTGVAKVNPENYIKKQYWKTDWRTAA